MSPSATPYAPPADPLLVLIHFCINAMEGCNEGHEHGVIPTYNQCVILPSVVVGVPRNLLSLQVLEGRRCTSRKAKGTSAMDLLVI